MPLLSFTSTSFRVCQTILIRTPRVRLKLLGKKRVAFSGVRPSRATGTICPTNGAGTRLSKERQIVLVSGGVESSTLLYSVYSKFGQSTLPLFFDYGQRANLQECEAYRNLCNNLGLHDNVEVDLGSLGRTFRARQKERRHVPLLHRNGVLLSIATSLAAQSDAMGIWIAICKDDTSWYASASTEFLKMSEMLLQTLEPKTSLHTPLIHLSKADVVQLGIQLNVPFYQTWSCMLDRKRHCGRCVQCRARKAAFNTAKVAEASGFYER